MTHSIQKYIRLWITLTAASVMVNLSSRLNAVLFLLGKALRFIFFIIFLFSLFDRTQTLAGYSLPQMVFFFLTFTIIDTLAQIVFREAYRFRQKIVSGDFDLVLVKPMSPLFRSLAGGADPLDMIMLVPYTFALVVVGAQLEGVTVATVLTYLLLLANGFLIAAGFHIVVLALAVLTTEIDHTIMIYRDITSMGRVPIDIYSQPLRGILLYLLPVGIMMTIPAKALMGLLNPTFTLIALGVGIAFYGMSVKLWNHALTKYASASS